MIRKGVNVYRRPTSGSFILVKLTTAFYGIFGVKIVYPGELFELPGSAPITKRPDKYSREIH